MTAPYFLRVTVPQPHLWNGRNDPYLYKAVVELRRRTALWIRSSNRWACDFIRLIRTRDFS